MTQERDEKTGIIFYRVNSDVYGNPRYVVHYLCLLTEAEQADGKGYDFAAKRANRIGGAKYRGRDFGGGIVFQSYNIDDTAEAIDRVKKEA